MKPVSTEQKLYKLSMRVAPRMEKLNATMRTVYRKSPWQVQAKLSITAIPRAPHTARSFSRWKGTMGYLHLLSQRIQAGMQQIPTTRGAITCAVRHCSD